MDNFFETSLGEISFGIYNLQAAYLDSSLQLVVKVNDTLRVQETFLISEKSSCWNGVCINMGNLFLV